MSIGLLHFILVHRLEQIQSPLSKREGMRNKPLKRKEEKRKEDLLTLRGSLEVDTCQACKNSVRVFEE